MSNNITGPSSSDPFATPPRRSSTPSTSTREDVVTPSSTREVISSDLQVFEGSDVMDRHDTIPQQFVVIQHWGTRSVYQASIQTPALEIPNPEEQSGPTPFEPSWQKATKDFFRDLVKEILIKKIEKSGEPMPTPAQIEERVNALMLKAYSKGEKLSESEKEIIGQATTETQKAWKLPSTWTIGTENVKDWTPIVVDVVPPVNIDGVRKEFLCGNLEQLFDALQKAVKKVGNAIPANDPNQGALRDVYAIILEALRNLKVALMEFQMKDAEASEKVSYAKIGEVEANKDAIEEGQRKQEEASENRKKQEDQAKVMKIVAPILATAIGIAGVIGTAVTFGMGAPLMVAAATSVISVVYSLLDAHLEITSQAVEAFKTFLVDNIPAEYQTLVKAIIATVLVLVIVAAIVSTNGGIAVNAATMTARQAVTQVLKTMTIQMGTIFLTSSNLIPELIIEGLAKIKVIDKDNEKIKMILQVVITAVMALSIMVMMGRGKAPIGPKKVDIDKLKLVQQVQDILKMSKFTVEAVQGVTVGMLGLELSRITRELGTIEEIQDLIQALIKMLTTQLTAAQQIMTAEGEWINSLDNAMASVFGSMRQVLNKSAQIAA